MGSSQSQSYSRSRQARQATQATGPNWYQDHDGLYKYYNHDYNFLVVLDEQRGIQTATDDAGIRWELGVTDQIWKQWDETNQKWKYWDNSLQVTVWYSMDTGERMFVDQDGIRWDYDPKCEMWKYWDTSLGEVFWDETLGQKKHFSNREWVFLQ